MSGPGYNARLRWLNIDIDVVVQFYPCFNVIFFCFKLIIRHQYTQKQKRIEFKPRIKLNLNICIQLH